ncbi:MAG: 6-bladed beta-propeller [Candidatus Aminicenantes bacterium]|nr:6-bladed beta-propeller [Candidatus Aminicenantes bacterium]
MKNAGTLGPVIILLALGFSACAKKDAPTAWKGKVTVEDGVRVIRNPAEPLYGELALDLEEDLQIGREDDENYIFGQIIDVQMDDEGTIYVCDVKTPIVQMYDRNGLYVRTIGKIGQGPGEYERPMRMALLSQPRRLYVQDMMRLKSFGPGGEYITEILLKSFPYAFTVGGDGTIWAALSAVSDEGRSKELQRISPQGETLQVLGRFTYDIYTKRESATTTVSFTTGYEYDLHLAKVDASTIVYGHSKDYALEVVGADGKPRLRIRNDEPAQEFTGEEKEKLAKFGTPGHKPSFYGLTTDDRGRIWVHRSNPLATRGQKREYDIYSRDGYFLYKTRLIYGRQFVVKNGALCARHVLEEEGLEVVKRYKIKNWDAIKDSAS